MSTATPRIQVGREIRSEWGWLWTRTKRLANLLAHPHILAAAVELVEAIDRHVEAHELDPKRVQLGDARFVKGLDYLEFELLYE